MYAGRNCDVAVCSHSSLFVLRTVVKNQLLISNIIGTISLFIKSSETSNFYSQCHNQNMTALCIGKLNYCTYVPPHTNSTTYARVILVQPSHFTKLFCLIIATFRAVGMLSGQASTPAYQTLQTSTSDEKHSPLTRPRSWRKWIQRVRTLPWVVHTVLK
jgi:hypothetical protein